MRDRDTTAAFGRLKRLVLVAVVACATWAHPASAQAFEIIKSFEDARGPFAPLVQGTDGAFYGTTEFGGTFGYGTVFRVALDGSAWRRSAIHSFNGADGYRPWSGLTLGTDGALDVAAGLTKTRRVTVTNVGDGPVTILSIAASGDFLATSPCTLPSTLAPGASCAIHVSFTPSATGVRTGALTVTSDAQNSPTTASLTGTGVLPLLLSDSQLFTHGAYRPTLTLSNPSSTLAISIASITVTTQFRQANDCGTSIPPLSACTVTVSYINDCAGNRGTLRIASSATTSPTRCSYTGGWGAPR